jgi:hypothetical protein
MGETQHKQRKMKNHMDEKLALSKPARELLENLAVDCASKPSSDNTFQYAFALAKSDDPKELKYAVDILDGLVKEDYEHQIDCMYGAATALYLLQDYEGARVRTIRLDCIRFTNIRNSNLKSDAVFMFSLYLSMRRYLYLSLST